MMRKESSTERHQSQALKRGHPADYLLSGVVRCGRCRRAFIGTSARGRSRLHHYYTCSTRCRYGVKECDADRLPRDDLEEVVPKQMVEVYADSDLIAEALAHAAIDEARAVATTESRLGAIRQERAAAGRSIDRYFAAFEEGTMAPATCQSRIEALEGRLDALIAEEQALEHEEEASTPPSPEIIAQWARNLDTLLRSGSAQQQKALIRKLVKELLVMGHDDIIPTYRIPALVRAPGDQVELPGIEPGSPDP